MKALSLITLAGALALAATLPVEAQSARERSEQTREEPRRGNGLARFAARALGASEDEADAAALLLPAVQQVREIARPGAGPQEQAGIEPDEIDYAGDAACAAAGYMKIGDIKGESTDASGEPCEPGAAALLLPAVQALTAGSAPEAASGQEPGEAEITLKRGAPQRR